MTSPVTDVVELGCKTPRDPLLCDSSTLAEFLSTQLGKFPNWCGEKAAQFLEDEEGVPGFSDVK